MKLQIHYASNFFILLIFFSSFLPVNVMAQSQDESNETLRLGVIGLVHDHVSWIFNRNKKDVNIVGIVETNQKAIARYKKRYKLHDSLFFETYEDLYLKAKPNAVSAFNATKKHLEVVAFFAPRKIPIMVEKPMATTYEDALKMAALSKQYSVPLLINYETSWYASTYEAKDLLSENRIGNLNKLVFNTGHPGPKEIGCSPEFLEWLTDPILNGGGALTDFGCYGANLSTWILNGQKPLAVSCVAKQTKPDLYPKVDDDTTLILEYEKQQVVIQASWNWSHNRKDMQLYGSEGYINCLNGSKMTLLEDESKGEQIHKPKPIKSFQEDPFRLLYEVVLEKRSIPPNSLYSVENNLIVSKILSLALLSAQEKKAIPWNYLD